MEGINVVDSQTIYEIRIEGYLSSSWSSWFEGMEIRHEQDGGTVLLGAIVDQAALHSVLMKIRDLGIPLISVNRLGQPERKGGE
jgi:hypothetical protein